MAYRSALLLAIIFRTAAAQAPDESNALNGPLTVFLQSDHATPSGVSDAMEREVESLVAPSGIRVTWKSAKDSNNQETYTRIAVVHLSGECDPGSPVRAGLAVIKRGDPEILGQTQVVDGRVLPFSDVRCNAVRKVIYHELRDSDDSDREELLGRALGRVMAHELYHVLLRTTSHGRRGLARPAQRASDLVAPRDTFAEADERRLASR